MKNKIGNILPFLLPLGVWFLPVPKGLGFDGLFVLLIFVSALFLWMTKGIDWPSLWVLAVLMLVPKLSVNEVLKSSFGNQTFAFLLFTFVLTYALSQTLFVKRIALWFVNLKFAKKSVWHLNIAFLVSVLALGSVMSPTVLFFVMYPILEEIFRVLGFEKDNKVAEMMLIGLVIVTSLSSGITPIAHVFPVLAMSAYGSITGLAISYTSYMLFAIPLGILIFIGFLGLTKYMYRNYLKEVSHSNWNLDIEIDPMDRQEKLVVAVFFTVVFFWISPELLMGISPTVMGYIKSLGTSVPPLIGIIVLAIVKVDNKALININEAMTKGVSWPSMMMTAAALALGSAMTHADIGLTTFVTTSIGPLVQNLPPILLIIIFVLWATIQSNLSSHMVTAQLVSSIAVPIFLSVPSLNAAAIAALIGMLASLGSATPPSMPYVAFAVSSGWTKPKSMLQVGIWVMILVVVLSVVIGYPLANILL